MSTEASISGTAHHGLTVREVVERLDGDSHHGLTDHQAAERLTRVGPNTLPVSTGAGLVLRILRQFHHPLIYVLLAAGTVTTALGEYIDSGVIIAVILVNAIVGLIQEAKAEAALEGLRSMVLTRATVIRDGRTQVVPSAELVPGDLVLVEAGDKIPADVRLMRPVDLRVNESALTGESLAVAKHEEVLPGALTVADRRNMAYSGTLVTAGGAAGIVVATGAQTELGEIHRLVRTADALATPLTRKLARFSRILTVAILGLAAVTFAIGLLRAQDAVQTFTAAIALAVGAIPEGLPAVVTITMAIGVARMARRHAVIRRLPAVETLGSTTVICSDKTGTLTENQMTVRALWTVHGRYDVTGSGYAPNGRLLDGHGAPVSLEADHALRWNLLAGAACNDATLAEQDAGWNIVGDPTEGAMIVVATKAGLDSARVHELLPRSATIPFSSERRYMATLHHDTATQGVTGQVIVAKGAVERILALCSAQMDADGARRPLSQAAVLQAADDLAERGLRVLATAIRLNADATEFDEEASPGSLVFTGLQAMLDPPRAAAVSAVATCHTAGISVRMITGDHAATAIASQLGLLKDQNCDSVLTGADLDTLPEEALPQVVDVTAVFARVSPEQKLRLVEALQSRSHVVAMTGDGVNDAPALRQADIGVAMGRSGTEVAKDAADMVLVDDDFASVEAAIEEGRGVFDNLIKFITWILPTNVGEGLVILLAILFGAALPIMPTQILWINMTTAVALGLMLAFEPKEAGIVTRPPRDPKQPLLTRVDSPMSRQVGSDKAPVVLRCRYICLAR
ncbi:HAD-IC family P-type ATPase [Lipingzhangella sp. LS1_29]|uniref:HAD-IC family P-type ATPase n=1 Tax=Lipingzhangella rawalii TaxID=2055835 RepID=A0ABU2HAH3_9ACTN|nr:HAD-IC family P-type ATPase [Lipingzhangella rawalii]MDS1272324.1 HAD-IC family P-type ATPase [Lipingzhangella rawalii]